MAHAAADNPLARTILNAAGEHEVSCVATEPETGEAVKIRLDKLCVGNRHRIVDLKTTRCAHIAEFSRDAAKYGYHIQAGTYRRIYALAAGVDPALIDFYIVAQEKTPPYPCVVFKMPEAWLDAGEVIALAQLKVGAECVKTGIWPGYADNRVVDLHLPDRAMAELEPIS